MRQDSDRAKIAQLAALVADVQEHAQSTDSALAELVDSARRAIPGADAAGITRVTAREGIRNVVATEAYVVDLDDVQEREQDGPCVTAAWENHLVRIDDVNEESRWPRYCAHALGSTPVRAVMSYRVFADKHNHAALNFFSERPRGFSDDAVELGFIFATHTALAWSALRREEQFRSALASRDVIGQAKGMLMERFGIDAIAAFELLKRLSQESNTPLYDIAGRVIESSGQSPDGDG